MYRVQSRRRPEPSLLAGRWIEPAAGMLDSEAVNAALSRHHAWRGLAAVRLRIASIKRREGTFHDEPDILYKREFFTPCEGGAAMPSDIVDVAKSAGLWRTRRNALSRVMSADTVEAIEERFGSIDEVIGNEYFCHEAGHMLGHDVLTKYERGYFHVQRSTLWPLVFVEELRADLHAFGFALELLPPERATAIFLYNVALRFGVHAAAGTGGKAYGTVPYLLFHLLISCGFLDVDSRGILRLRALRMTETMAAMRACAEHAEQHLTAVELASDDLGDVAIHAALYHRARVEDGAVRDLFVTAFHVAP